jgi:hypothetical protein
MHHCAKSIFKVGYLREYESIFETALAHESVDPGILFDEKNQRSKTSWYCPFNDSTLQYVEIPPVVSATPLVAEYSCDSRSVPLRLYGSGLLYGKECSWILLRYSQCNGLLNMCIMPPGRIALQKPCVHAFDNHSFPTVTKKIHELK